MANGWVPAEPMRSPLLAAVSVTRRRSALSCAPASVTSAQGAVQISSTDSISSGLISPASSCAGESSSSDSIAWASSSEPSSRIISSSSTPIVKLGGRKWWSIPAAAYSG